MKDNGKGSVATGSPLERLGIHRQAQVLMLGTFHFNYPGLDTHKPKDKIDILSDERQAEVRELVDLLADFKPTKVAVERRLQREAELNEEYQAYRGGTFELPRSEVYQLGFRIAARHDHTRLYPIDEGGRQYDSIQQLAAECAKILGLPEEERSEEEVGNILYQVISGGRMGRFMELLRENDALLMKETLREHLLRMNSPETVRFGHGGYLSWLDGPPGNYAVVDHVTGWWYNRNLRIFSNLKRISDSPNDRILMIIGSGHLPILRHAIECSWDFELVEVAKHLLG